MKTRFITAIAALTLAPLLALAQAPQPGQPQATPSPPPPPAPSPQAEKVSEADLTKFAQIYVEVENTRREMSADMSQAQTQEEAREVQLNMQEEIERTIQDHGWTVDKYNETATLINANPDQRDEVLSMIDSRRQS